VRLLGTTVVQIEVAEVELKIKDELSGTVEVEPFAGDTNDVTATVFRVRVRTVDSILTHALCQNISELSSH